jgi:hypothetical protein
MARGSVKNRLTTHIPRINAEKDMRAKQAVRMSTVGINARAKIAMAEPKSGRPRADGHIASAPGEAPAIDTGLLINSLQESYEGDFTGYAYTIAEYAPPLEFGSADGKLAARPFYRPAAQAERSDFVRRMKDIYG